MLGPWITADRNLPDIAVFDHTPAIQNEKGEQVRQYAPLLFEGRENRGVQHDVCGGLMSTLKHDWSKEDVRRKLRSGDLDLNESFYCRIFYLGFQGDPNNVDVGFLQSRYLVRGYRVVFTGPSSAQRDDVENAPPEKRHKGTSTSIRKPVCDILKMNGKVTPRSIAFITVSLHFSLTNAYMWAHEYYGFSYPQMYNFIVDYFETGLGRHTGNMRTQIFSKHASSSSSSRTAVNSFEQLRAQHRAREALELEQSLEQSSEQ
ncbi:hypothetical protein FB451DRAFT_1512407 [Mycena latifolia]|nr:hypothetical protein FB451DRAFT_1512407 [Mycena latifolia]